MKIASAHADPSHALSASLLDQILERLGLAGPPEADLSGLRALYGAWCWHVPFDNVRKMIALRAVDGRVPGPDAGDFFAGWLAHGAGATCWPSSYALFALLRAAGFAARLVAGAMRDMGVVNHGSVKVRVAGEDWLVDSSLLTNTPLPLGTDVFSLADPVVTVEVEPDASTHVIWVRTPPNTEHMPCRVLVDPADHAYYVERCEFSRQQSPFNHRLYARRNRPGELVILAGHTLYVKTSDGIDVTELGREELCEALHTEIGLSEGLIATWVDSGCLDLSFEPAPPPTHASDSPLPPSMRSPTPDSGGAR